MLPEQHTMPDLLTKPDSILFRSLLIAVLVLSFSPPGQSFAQERTETATEIITRKAPRSPQPAPDLDSVSEEIVRLTNAFRRQEKRDEVQRNAKLQATAEYFAKFMADEDKYGHNADGQSSAERAKEHDYAFCLVSENIAYQWQSAGFGVKELANGFVEGWRKSPEHRENMLDPDVLDTGVAVAQSKESGYFYAVQMFGRSRDDSIGFQVANESGIVVHYRLGEKSFALEPQFTRMHELCRTTKLELLGEDPDISTPLKVVQTHQGDAFRIVAGSTDAVTIERP